MVRKRANSKLLFNIILSIEILLSEVVRLIAVTNFLVIHYQESRNNAGASHGIRFLQSTFLWKVSLKSLKNVQQAVQFTTVLTKMDPLLWISIAWSSMVSTSKRLIKMKTLPALMKDLDQILNLVS